jgi:hypothetical protein
MAELRTKHARKQATDRFCFPLITGTRGIQGDHFRDRPTAELNSNHILIFAFGQKEGGLGRVEFESATIGKKRRLWYRSAHSDIVNADF